MISYREFHIASAGNDRYEIPVIHHRHHILQVPANLVSLKMSYDIHVLRLFSVLLIAIFIFTACQCEFLLISSAYEKDRIIWSLNLTDLNQAITIFRSFPDKYDISCMPLL